MIAKYIVAGAAIAFSVGVYAGESDIQKKFNQMDTNKDGKISVEEATGHNNLLSDWTTIDKNKDLELEYSEFSAFESNSEYVPDNNSTDEDTIGAAPR